jgi:hypothetical protein
MICGLFLTLRSIEIIGYLTNFLYLNYLREKEALKWFLGSKIANKIRSLHTEVDLNSVSLENKTCLVKNLESA